MSAICGIIRFDGRTVSRAELETMVASSPYRGPDGSGYWREGNAGFAYQAFHLTPESVFEAQPWRDPDNGLVLVADARIDNREELERPLSDELSRLTRLLHSTDPVESGPGAIPDSLYILAAWNRWGEGCVEHLLGDFVFAVWDNKNQRLFLARDPLGCHCLHVHATAGGFVFASELTAILDLPCVTPRINEDRVLREIEYLPSSHDATFFEGIHYLPPAHCLVLTRAGQRRWRYWDVDPQFRTVYGSEAEYAEHLLELLGSALDSRLRCRGPVGISLSGGNDSTLLAACAAQRLGHAPGQQARLLSFSFVFERLRQCDERAYIEAAVAHCGIDARYVIADDLWTFHDLERQCVARDYLWTNCFLGLSAAVVNAAQQAGCRLLINGQAGDSLFAGERLAVADLLAGFHPLRLGRYLLRHAGSLSWRDDMLRGGLAPLLPNGLIRRLKALGVRRQENWIKGLGPQWARRAREIRCDETGPATPGGLLPSARKRYRSVLNPVWSQAFAAGRALGHNRFGLEQCSPYYDRRLLTFLLSLPAEVINRPGAGRHLQQRAMRKVLPAKVCERTGKTSFTPLIAIGLQDKARHSVRALLNDPIMVRRGWVRKDWLARQSSEPAWDDGGYPLANCLHLELWLRACEPALAGSCRWAEPQPAAPLLR